MSKTRHYSTEPFSQTTTVFTFFLCWKLLYWQNRPICLVFVFYFSPSYARKSVCMCICH